MSLRRERAMEIPRLDWRANLRICWLFIRRSLRLWTYFKLNFLISQAEVVSNLIIFATIARFHSATGSSVGVGGSYVAFVILGLILNAILTAALAAPYNGLLDSFW